MLLRNRGFCLWSSTQRFRNRIAAAAASSSSASPAGAAVVAARTAAGAAASAAPRPTRAQLRTVFVAAMVPMVGFGIMDQTILLFAGDAIDNTLGLRLGLSTLSAAACGQVISDASGTVFGGWVELMALRIGLRLPDLSPAQRAMKLTKGVTTAGAAFGVICGCLIGMLNLLVIDTTSKEREKKQREMDTLFAAIMTTSHDLLKAECCSLFLVDRERGELWSKVATDRDGILQTRKLITVPLDRGIVGEVVRTKQIINIADAYSDSRFYQQVDKEQGSRTDSILAVPVLSEDGDVVAVIEMMNKRGKQPFDELDTKLCTMLASHVSVFLKHAMND